jgi:acylphosphatase
VVESTRQERRQVFYQGFVQGVGFRFTTFNVARAFHVTGFVRNLADGRVQITCEGVAAELDAFLADVAQRLAANIERVEAAREEASGEFEEFKIRG